MRTEKHIIKNRYSTHGIHRNIPVYEMNTVHCSASPMEGYKGTEVTLIDNAAWNEKFSAWALTGATATGNNIVLNNDVTAQGLYETAKTNEIIGIMHSITRKGKEWKADDRIWRLYSWFWMAILPVRRWPLALWRRIFLRSR